MTRRPASLAIRLTISIGAVITIVLLAFGWIVERSINSHFIQQDVDELNAVAGTLRHALALMPAGEDQPARQRRLANATAGQHNVQYRISTADGAALYETPGADPAAFAVELAPAGAISADTASVWESRGETFRGAALKIGPGHFAGEAPLVIAVATRIDFHLRYLEEFHRTLRLMTIVACIVALLATWFAVFQGHAPIRRISRDIRSIQSDQLQVRLRADAVPAELAELVTAFNQTLGRLEDAFRRLSEFSADIAHELRTPITNIRTQTEVALSRTRTVGQYREILYSNLEEYERMAKTVDDMLFLAQADNRLLKPEAATIDLQTEIGLLIDYFGAWAEERGIALMQEGDRLDITGDRLMIRRALSNLLSNAIRHTPAGETVHVRVGCTGKAIGIRIRNPGPPIPAEHISRIFDRFYRPDTSRRRAGGGAGLGLAIARAIINAHGGDITVSSTADRTEFEILLPDTSDDPAEARRDRLPQTPKGNSDGPTSRTPS